MRHRTRIMGKHAVMYDPQEKQKWAIRRLLNHQIKEAFNNENKEIVKEASNLASADYFSLSLSFYVKIPESATAIKRKQMAWGLIKPSKKPDFDNYEKFICDCANGFLYKDDAMIVKCITKKMYSENPRTEIEIMARKNPNENDPALKILSFCNPNEIRELIKIVNQIELILNSNTIYEEEDYQDIASLLSKLADNHADLLRKISKNCPGFWKNNEYEKITMEGKTLT